MSNIRTYASAGLEYAILVATCFQSVLIASEHERTVRMRSSTEVVDFGGMLCGSDVIMPQCVWYCCAGSERCKVADRVVYVVVTSGKG